MLLRETTSFVCLVFVLLVEAYYNTRHFSRNDMMKNTEMKYAHATDEKCFQFTRWIIFSKIYYCRWRIIYYFYSQVINVEKFVSISLFLDVKYNQMLSSDLL